MPPVPMTTPIARTTTSSGMMVDPATVLARAERAGRVVSFSYGPPTLSELFREKVAR
jgi:hypothetical protein